MLSNQYRQLRAALQPGLANPADPVYLVRDKMHAIHPTAIPDDAQVNELVSSPVYAVSVQTPQLRDDDSAVMMVHGGAFVSTSVEHYVPYAAALSRFFQRPVVVYAYRLAPEHPFPAALDDSLAVYQFLLERFAPHKLAVIGDSCGGGIGLSMLCELKDRKLPLPAAYAGLTPWLDLTMSGKAAVQDTGDDPFVCTEWIRARGLDYAADTPTDHPRVSPLFADLRDLPPLYFASGSQDITRDDSRRAAALASEAGTSVVLDIAPGMIHGYHGLSALAPECAAGCQRIADFLNAHLE